MRGRWFPPLASVLALLPAAGEAAAGVVIETETFRYVIGDDGLNRHFIDKRTGLDLSLRTPPSSCARILRGGAVIPATRADATPGGYVLRFGDTGVTAQMKILARKAHAVLEVVSVAGLPTPPGVNAGADELVFADIPLALTGAPGEPFVACALALNLRTNVVELPGPVSRLTASAYARFGFAGARVALVGCPPDALRKAHQQAVEDAPEIPKSPLGGPWAFDKPIVRGSYLFDFGLLTETTADDWIRLARSIGFTQIDFHAGHSIRFGDYVPNPQLYPQGAASLKAVVDRLHAAGISAGLHTYAFFIAKTTPWVTPVPDARLATDATFALAADVPADATTIPVSDSTQGVSAATGFFVRNSATLRIGEELVEFAGVTPAPPYAFTGCRRGACGTTAAAHAKGTPAGRLKEMFGLFVPDPESTLFPEIAQRTADLYNACGFDMVYLDALDGDGILAGDAWGWHYGSKFAFEVFRRLKKPPLMEMSVFHHHLWYLRSRAVAWDHPRRGYKRFVDVHIRDNEPIRRMGMPTHLGWWQVQGAAGPQEEPTYPEDIEYLCGKAIGTDSSLSLMGIQPANAGSLNRLAEVFRNYETLRLQNYFSPAIRKRLAVPGDEFRLAPAPGGKWNLRPARYDRHRVTGPDDGSRAWKVEDRFGRQPAKLRIAALISVAPYDTPEGETLIDPAAPGALAERASAPGVTPELTSTAERVKVGSVSLRFAALNATTASRGAWTTAGQAHPAPLNLAGKEGLGFWICGDGQGEVLNVQLRNPSNPMSGLGEHYVVVDFTGWRYVELVEAEGERHDAYVWPYDRPGGPYTIFRETVRYDQIGSVSLWLNHLPPGRKILCDLSSVRALPLVKGVLHRPAVTVGGKTVTFPVDLESGSCLELEADGKGRVYGPGGELRGEVVPEGAIPPLKPGSNDVSFTCEPIPGGVRPRAIVTVVSEGDPLK